MNAAHREIFFLWSGWTAPRCNLVRSDSCQPLTTLASGAKTIRKHGIRPALTIADIFLKGDGIVQSLGLNADALFDGVVLAFAVGIFRCRLGQPLHDERLVVFQL